MKRFCAFSLLLGMFLGLGLVPANAETLQIQISGLDFMYDGAVITDSTSVAIGNAIATEADELATIEFFVDGDWVAELATSDDLKLYADILIEGANGLPKDGGTILADGNGNSLGFELLAETSGGSNTLSRLFSANIEEFAVNYTVFDNPISIEFTTMAGPVSELLEQALPMGLSFDPEEQISISLSSVNLANVTDDGTHLTGFEAFGTGEVVGTQIPEPGTLVLLASSIAGLLLLRRRKAH